MTTIKGATNCFPQTNQTSLSETTPIKATKKLTTQKETQKNTFSEQSVPTSPTAQTAAPRTGVTREISQPTTSAHTVQSGDTLSHIAAKHGMSWQELAKYNNLDNPDLIHPGQEIRIPPNQGHTQGTQAPVGQRPPTQLSQTSPTGGSTPPESPTGGATPPGADGVGEVNQTAPTGDTTGGVSLDQLRQIMPNVSESRAREMLPHLNRAMNEAQINTPRRQAAFLAQLAHESGEFRYMEEIASGAAYEGRRDLGNTQPGDGRRFKGRGPIQLTGRHNYTEAGRALGLDLAGNPAQVATPEVGFRTSAWYWNSRNLNQYADSGNFDQITRRINGGFNGKADRDRYYARALRVLGG